MFLFGGWGLFEAGRLSTFSAFRMGAYSRWVLIRGWALIWLNTVTVNVVNNRIEKHIYQKNSLDLPTKPQNLLDQNLTPNLREALKDITRKTRTLEIEFLCLFIRHTLWIFRLFWTPIRKKILTKIKPPPKTPFQINFPIQKNTGIENFKPKTNPLIIRVTSLEIGGTPPPLHLGLTDPPRPWN